MSERKEQAIYNAVHDAIMRLRIEILRVKGPTILDKFDTQIAQAGHAAGMAAIAAYRQPLTRKRVTKP